MEYSIKTINNTIEIFNAYKSGLISPKELCDKAINLLDYDTYCLDLQTRTDSDLLPSVPTIELIGVMIEYLKRDYVRFSGMDIDKGYYNDLDSLYLIVQKFVNTFFKYYYIPDTEIQPQQIDYCKSQGNKEADLKRRLKSVLYVIQLRGTG